MTAALRYMIHLLIVLCSTSAQAGMHFLPTNPTCFQEPTELHYSVGVTRFLSDYYLLIVENVHSKNSLQPKLTRLALQLVNVTRFDKTEVFTDKEGKFNLTVVRTPEGEVGTLNWDQDGTKDFFNKTFKCRGSGHIFFETKPRAESRLSVGN